MMRTNADTTRNAAFASGAAARGWGQPQRAFGAGEAARRRPLYRPGALADSPLTKERYNWDVAGESSGISPRDAESTAWSLGGVRRAIEEGLGMQKLVLGILFVSVNGLLLWLLAHGEAGVNPLVVGAAGVVFNLVLGVRVGYTSAQAYFQDVTRVNRYLGDQNEDLVLCNRELLERFASPGTDSASQGHEEEVPPARAQG